MGKNGTVNENYRIDKNSEFVINLLKDRIFLLEQELIGKNSKIDFLVKQQMSLVATFSEINYDNEMNHELEEKIKNKTSLNGSINKDDRKKFLSL